MMIKEKKGNKGEWSEFYAFIKILIDQKLFSADENYIISPNSFIKVLSVIRNEGNDCVIYDIDNTNKTINITRNNNYLSSVPFYKISGFLNTMKNHIKNNNGSFAMEETDELMRILNCTSLKSPSNKKIDLKVKIQDVHTGTEQVKGFSIKSQIGNSSTLFNASKVTNIIFKIVNKSENRGCNYNRRCFCKEKILKDTESIEFVKYTGDIFHSNLQFIDLQMPYLLAQYVKYHYLGFDSSIKCMTHKISNENILNLNNQSIYEYKIKELLASFALGMVASKDWDYKEIATGGYIIVKDEGELVCYHLYDRERFKHYLFDNVELQTPSTNKHEFLNVFYDEFNQKSILLNFQIRFNN